MRPLPSCAKLWLAHVAVAAGLLLAMLTWGAVGAVTAVPLAIGLPGLAYLAWRG